MARKSLPVFYGHSASKLDLAEFCGHAGTIQTAAGRAAIISRAVHAIAEGDQEKVEALLASLTEEERAEAASYRLPVSVELLGEVLAFKSAAKEVRWALDDSGCPAPYDSEGRITRGIADFVWTGDDVVIVGDLKRGRQTTEAGTATLQLQAAGIALAQEAGVSSYLPVLWFLDEGAMAVGDVVRLDSAEATRLWDRVRFAAQNQEGPVTGPHCSRCYGYFQCPAYVSQVVDPESWLAPLSGKVELDDTKAAETMVRLEALEKAAGRMKDALKTYVTQGGRIEHGGKSYEPVWCAGRKSIDKAKLEEALGDISPYEKQGRDYQMWKWVKVKA